jgi:hypothetical protein
MFVTSSFTSKPAGWVLSKLCQNGGAGLPAAVNRQAELAASANKIAGQSATVTNIQCIPDPLDTNPQNPRVRVTVTRTGAPTFFARIFGANTATVTATATAEAYNASGFSRGIEVTNVKPWLIPNCNPTGPVGSCSSNFFVKADGNINETTSGAFIGSKMVLERIFSGAPSVRDLPTRLTYYSLIYPVSPSPVCSASGACQADPDNYINNIGCVSSLPFRCGQRIGPSETIRAEDTDALFGSPTRTGARCLIHADSEGLNNGQDSFSGGPAPVSITAGSNNPNTSLLGATKTISRSDSVVTVPLYDGKCLYAPGPSCSSDTKVIGFLQLGILQTLSGPGEFEADILNVVGCSDAASVSSPISGGGSSLIPVRLVQTP